MPFPSVIPAVAKRRAGIQELPLWMPAFAGMTIRECAVGIETLGPSAQPQHHVAEAEQDLDDDEADDVPFEPGASLVLHQVQHRADGLVDEAQLAFERAAALGE